MHDTYTHNGVSDFLNDQAEACGTISLALKLRPLKLWVHLFPVTEDQATKKESQRLTEPAH